MVTPAKTASPCLQERVPERPSLDLRLPDVDRLDLLTQFRIHDRGVSVIVMTAYGSPSLEQEIRRRGAVDFLRKPFHPIALCERIKAILANGAAPPPDPAAG